MIESYNKFIEKAKENPDMFDALGGEDYFKRVYNNFVKNENDYKRIRKAFITTPLAEKSCIADLDKIDDINDTKRVLECAQHFGQSLMWLIDNCDALYVCPEVASFMKLSSFFKGVSEAPNGVYKFGTFGNESYRCNCYKAPNDVAEKDCILLHLKDDTWKKLEVKISGYYQRKYEAAKKIPLDL